MTINTDLAAPIMWWAMNVDCTAPTSVRRPVQSVNPQSMGPLLYSCVRKLIYFVPWIVAPSPVSARPYPVLCSRNVRCFSKHLLYIESRTGPTNLWRFGPLYLVMFGIGSGSGVYNKKNYNNKNLLYLTHLRRLDSFPEEGRIHFAGCNVKRKEHFAPSFVNLILR